MLFSVLPLNLKVLSLKGAYICNALFFSQNFGRSAGVSATYENNFFVFKRQNLAAVDSHGVGDASLSGDFSGDVSGGFHSVGDGGSDFHSVGDGGCGGHSVGDGGSGGHSVGGGGGSVAWN